jgi:tetratricopeptide (TPR) repeat protein
MLEDPTLSLNGSGSAPPELPSDRESWGDFQLVARVGRGGFGEVYRAWDPHLQREVALKLLLPGSVTGDEQYRSLLREARALAAVQHPNVVHVYGIDRHDGRVGFWTDFVSGKTLADLLARQGPFGYREAALIGLDVARALSAVHRAGILHRDIKAENVMREEGGRILLMDFGLSTLPQAASTLSGTPNYMAPELFEGGAATVATDIYAMGVLLYYLVACEYPLRLTGVPFAEAAAALRQRKPLIDLRPELPESFLLTVNTATQLDPAKRFATAGQLAEALAQSLGISAEADSPVPPATGRQKMRLMPIVAAALALAVALWAAVRTETVRNWFHRGSAAAPASADAYDEYLKAQDLLQRSYKDANIAAAAAGFQQVLHRDPNFALAAAGLGRAWFLQYRNNRDPKLLDQARAETLKALQLDPDLAPPYVTLARMATLQGQTALAMQQVKKAISLDPHSAEAYGAQAELDQADGRIQEALAAVQHAIDLAPGDWHWPVLLGVMDFSRGKISEAAAELQKGTELDPQNTIALYDLGLARMQLGDFQGARQAFEKDLAIQPDADAYRALGSLLMVQGQYREAEEMDRKSIALRPDDYEVWGNLGGACLWAGEREKSQQAFRKAIQIAESRLSKSPDDPHLLAALADYYASVQQAPRSEIMIRKAPALAPDDPDVQYECGDSWELLNQRARAIPLLAKAVAVGFNAAEFARNPELAGLRADPAFRKALEQAKAEIPVDKSRALQ